LPFSVDRMLAQEVPKLFQLADDMHYMASYMNDLRIVAILGTVLGIGGGLIFLLYKYFQKKKSDGYDVCPQNVDEERGRGEKNGRHGAHWQERAKVADIEAKLAIGRPNENLQASMIRNGDQKYTPAKGDVSNV